MQWKFRPDATENAFRSLEELGLVRAKSPLRRSSEPLEPSLSSLLDGIELLSMQSKGKTKVARIQEKVSLCFEEWITGIKC